jgi:hypothetical protein
MLSTLTNHRRFIRLSFRNTSSLLLMMLAFACMAKGESIRPWGGVYVETKGYQGASSSSSTVNDSVQVSSQQKYRWSTRASSGGTYPNMSTIDANAQAVTSSDKSRMLTASDSFSNWSSADLDLSMFNSNEGLWSRPDEPMTNSYARAEWKNDSIRIDSPEGLQTPNRVKLLFEARFELRKREFHASENGGSFGQYNITVNDKSIEIKGYPRFGVMNGDGEFVETRYTNAFPDSKTIPIPGSELDQFFDKGFDLQVDGGTDYTRLIQDPAVGLFSVELDVDSENWTENFSAVVESITGHYLRYDDHRFRATSKSITLGLVDVTTMDGVSLESLGYKLEYASDLAIANPVPEPSTLLSGSVLVAAACVFRRRILSGIRQESA